MAGMFDMMKKAQAMQAGLQKAQEELKTLKVTGIASGGLVEVDMSGTFDVLAVRISPKAIDADDVGTTEDLTMVAFNDAAAKVRKTTEEKIGAVTGGLKLPGM